MTPAVAARHQEQGRARAAPQRASALRERTRRQWQQRLAQADGLWVFGYGSLIWRPEFDVAERHHARVYGWHRALAMWSHVNRGTPAQPGLVFALLPGGSCRGVVFRIADDAAGRVFDRLWEREMPGDVYTPAWLSCQTASGPPVNALAFTLSPRSASYTGTLTASQYRDIFRHARGRYGTTLDYARYTYASLTANGIQDRRLARLLACADRR
ncbi:MAG: gamma-glutamylcyclotransferase [Ottowia sp.]|nr:gamma-glutamylcyclotransferase [Ottowia sp.]